MSSKERANYVAALRRYKEATSGNIRVGKLMDSWGEAEQEEQSVIIDYADAIVRFRVITAGAWLKWINERIR